MAYNGATALASSSSRSPTSNPARSPNLAEFLSRYTRHTHPDPTSTATSNRSPANSASTSAQLPLNTPIPFLLPSADSETYRTGITQSYTLARQAHMINLANIANGTTGPEDMQTDNTTGTSTMSGRLSKGLPVPGDLPGDSSSRNFPYHPPPPPNTQIAMRLPSQTHHFPVLDSSFQAVHPTIFDEPRMVRKGRYAAEDPSLDGGFNRGRKDARKPSSDALAEGVKMHMGFVEVASRRLQGAVGERGDLEFALPGRLHQLASPEFASDAIFNQSNLNSGPKAHAPQHSVGNPAISSQTALPGPPGFSEVDLATGNGLREYLLSMGKQGRARKIECNSIAFHDITPEGFDATPHNKLLAFYEKDMGSRVDAYEVDIPAVLYNPATNTNHPGSESWIWFLISRPLVRIALDDVSTNPDLDSSFQCAPHPEPGTPNSSSTYHSRPSQSRMAAMSSPPALDLFPAPNFPFYPAPTSWVVFACPLANVTKYDDTAENYDDYYEAHSAGQDTYNSWKAPHPESSPHRYIATLLSKNSKARHLESENVIHKRRDFDFSHQGTPIFEFSSANSIPHWTAPCSAKKREFLSIEKLGPFYYGRDSCVAFSHQEYEQVVNDWQHSLTISDALKEGPTGWGVQDEKTGRVRSEEYPSHMSGCWWKRFFESIYVDEARWRCIRNAMGRGVCRVIMRWDEVDEGGEKQKDTEMSDLSPSRQSGTSEGGNCSGSKSANGGLRFFGRAGGNLSFSGQDSSVAGPTSFGGPLGPVLSVRKRAGAVSLQRAPKRRSQLAISESASPAGVGATAGARGGTGLSLGDLIEVDDTPTRVPRGHGVGRAREMERERKARSEV